MASPVGSGSTEMVTLKDGTEVSQQVLIGTMMRLKALAKKEFAALLEFVEKCKEPKYQFVANSFGDSKKILTSCELIDDQEHVDADVERIVLNAIEGSELHLELVNPIKEEPCRTIRSKRSYYHNICMIS